jgi:hypothetical protein
VFFAQDAVQAVDIEVVVVVVVVTGSIALESKSNLLPRQSHSRKRRIRTCSLLNGN